MDLNGIAALLVAAMVLVMFLGRYRPQINVEEVLCRTGTRIMPPEEQDATRMKIIQAGISITPEFLYGIKALLATGCILTSVLFILSLSLNWIALALLAPILYFVPDWWLSRKRARRQTEIKLALSDFSKMLAIALTAGAHLILALSEAAKAVGGSLKEEINITIKDHNAGKPISEALLDMAKRTDVDELNALVRTLSQAHAQGAQLAETMTAYSEQMRMVRKFETMEQAGKLSVKMVLPVLVFVLMPVLMVIGYPAVYSLKQAF